MRVVICDGSVLRREGLARILTAAGERVVAFASTAETLLVAVAHHRPDLVVVEARLPPANTDNGARAARRIRTGFPCTAVLVLSEHIELSAVIGLPDRRSFGYLLTDRVRDVGRFVAIARAVADGAYLLDPAVAAAAHGRHDHAGGLGALTAREHDVLALIADGRSNAGIADALALSARTVECHITRLLAKLGLDGDPDVHRRVLAALAYQRAKRPMAALAA